MATYHQIILLTIVILCSHDALCKKDLLMRRNTHFIKSSRRDESRVRRAANTPTAKEKETNKLVLAALYGGLGQGIPSSKNFDYANSLNTKIQSAGGYGLPPGIYSYAFDPSTGMPFMCDPTKTPPGASKSQAAGAAAINPPIAARKPAADESSENVPSEIGASTSAPAQDIHPSSTNTNKVITAESPPGTNTVGTNTGGANTVGTDGAPEQRLSPIEHTQPSQTVQHDAVSNANPTSLPGKEETTPNRNDDNMDEMNDMTSSLPSNEDHDGITPTPNQHKTRSAVSEKMASSEHLLEKPSTVTPVQQSTGSKVENHVSNDGTNHVQPSGVTSPPKGVQVKVGSPLYVEKPKTNPQSSTQTKVTSQRLTPLIDNYQKELKSVGKVKQSANSLKKYFHSKMAKKNEITIKLPEIPPCPDMKNYHWPWNCLGKGNTVKKECIQNYPGTFSYQGATFPYEDYGHLYDYNANEN